MDLNFGQLRDGCVWKALWPLRTQQLPSRLPASSHGRLQM